MPTQTWTIKSLINWAAEYLTHHGLDAPRLSAELLLAHSLGLDERVNLYLDFDRPLSPAELAAFKELLLRRKAGEPVAYILGQKEFWGLELQVGPGVLIPRPESEHLVEQALARLEGQDAPHILDLCTGSGAVALASLSALPGARAVGVDKSPKALAFAARNAKKLGLHDRFRVLEGDLFAPVAAGEGFFDLITANPPYVTQAQWEALSKEVSGFEPHEALVPGPGGMELASVIIKGAPAHLRSGGWLLMELGQGQMAGAMGLARGTRAYDKIQSAPDLAGIERVLACQRGDYG